MLKGQAKTDYQREYMKRYRSNKNKVLDPVENLLDPGKMLDPVLDPVRPTRDVYICGKKYTVYE